MSYIPGIDTYTDGVIVVCFKKILCKAKALTTKENGTIGIQNCLDHSYCQNIGLASLSTRLATNTIVESRGCTVGFI